MLQFPETAETTVQPSQSGTNENTSIRLVGLAPHTTYHFRIVGTNTTGMGESADQSFTTFPKSNISDDGAADLLVTDTTGAVSLVTELTGSSAIYDTGLIISSSLTWCGMRSRKRIVC